MQPFARIRSVKLDSSWLLRRFMNDGNITDTFTFKRPREMKERPRLPARQQKALAGGAFEKKKRMMGLEPTTFCMARSERETT
jgi:hypothetical protein